MLQSGQMLYHPGNCLNVKKPFARACKICFHICPHQAISDYRELDLSRCTECGACMAACPSDGFADRGMDDFHEYLIQASEIILNCPQAVPMGFEISCLGLLDRDLWLTLMVYSYHKPVSLLTGVCSQCMDKDACANSVKLFKDIHAVWPDHPRIQISVKPDSGEAEPTSPSQTKQRQEENVRNWRDFGRKKIENLLPGLAADETYNIPKTRQWLAEALEIQAKIKIPFQALLVSDSCTSCGVCAAICPQGALTKRQKGETIQLVLEAVKCVQCNRCIEICQPQALSLGIKQFDSLLLHGKILLHEGSPRYCSSCGKQIFDNSEPPLCLACLTKDSNRRDFLR